MPFPNDETIMKTAADLLEGFQGVFGKHPGMRPAHAKGIILTGTFKPSPEAAKLSTGPHFNAPSTPVWVRFSNSTGIPNIPDIDPNADPPGIAIRFQLGNRKHTDIVSHSVPFFPTRTGAEFLEFLQAIASSPPDAPHPNNVEKFVGSHPSTLAFVQCPKPAPKSYGTQQYYSVSAFKLIDSADKETFIRYHIVPAAGVDTYDAEALKTKDVNYLQTEIQERVKSTPVGFKILAQVAEEGDVTDDATVHWPESRKVVELGSFELDGVLEDNAANQKYAIFDPIPRVQGVDASDDPLLEMRAALYLLSGKQRRAA